MTTVPLTPPQDPSWRGHVRATLKLGLPLIGSQLAFIGLGVTDTVMLGWYGVEPLAASVLGTQLIFLAMITGSGPANAVSPIVANALGAGDERTVRRSVRMALWAALIYCLFAMPLLWNAGALLVALGQEPVLADMAQDYVRIAILSLPVAIAFNAIRSYLTALEMAGIILWANIAGLILNGLVNYAFIFGNWGAPELGIRGAAIATVLTNALMLLVCTLWAVTRPSLKRYEILVRIHQPDWAALREVFRLGWPISLTLLAEVSLFSISSFMMGWLGTIALAAHGIALQVISVMFMVPLGLAFAATVRVGRALGRKDREGLYRASIVVSVLAFLIACCFVAMLVIWPESLINLFLEPDNPDRPAIIAVGVPLLAVAALFQVADTAQVMAAAMLRGLKDMTIPMIMAVVSYLVVGVSLAYLLGFQTSLGGVGVWLGLAAGLILAALLMGWRYLRLIRTAVGTQDA